MGNGVDAVAGLYMSGNKGVACEALTRTTHRQNRRTKQTFDKSIHFLAIGVQEACILGIGNRIDERYRLRIHVGIDVSEGEQA